MKKPLGRNSISPIKSPQLINGGWTNAEEGDGKNSQTNNWGGGAGGATIVWYSKVTREVKLLWQFPTIQNDHDFACK